jgi:hypothetical protein
VDTKDTQKANAIAILRGFMIPLLIVGMPLSRGEGPQLGVTKPTTELEIALPPPTS